MSNRLRKTLFIALLVSGIGVRVADASAIGLSSSTPGSLYSIDTSTGAATFLVNVSGAANTSFVGLDFLGGTLYASDVFNGQVYTFGSINVATGAFTSINNQGGSFNWHALAANQAAGFLYTVDLDAGNILKTVTPGGAIATIGATNAALMRGLAYDDATATLFGTDGTSLFTLNTATGAATLVGALGVSCGFHLGLDIDPSTGTLYMNFGNFCGGGQLFTVNRATGLATFVGLNGATDGFGIDGIAVQDAGRAVPEPATLVLVGSALALTRARRRR